jgi:uncharacterized protein YjbI with pentapeptide repeats
MSEADLSRANMYEADLSHADLSGADMSGADLRGAVKYTTDAALPGRWADKEGRSRCVGSGGT